MDGDDFSNPAFLLELDALISKAKNANPRPGNAQAPPNPQPAPGPPWAPPGPAGRPPGLPPQQHHQQQPQPYHSPGPNPQPYQPGPGPRPAQGAIGGPMGPYGGPYGGGHAAPQQHPIARGPGPSPPGSGAGGGPPPHPQAARPPYQPPQGPAAALGGSGRGAGPGGVQMQGPGSGAGAGAHPHPPYAPAGPPGAGMGQRLGGNEYGGAAGAGPQPQPQYGRGAAKQAGPQAAKLVAPPTIRPRMRVELKIISGPSGPRLGAFHQHHNGLRDALSDMARHLGGAWDAQNKAWGFPLESMAGLQERLGGVQAVQVEVVSLSPIALKILRAASAAAHDDVALYDTLSASFEERLMGFQREGVKFGLRHGGRVLIGDEMGLGKTVQCLALLSCYRGDWPALIICPASLRETWGGALADWLQVPEKDMLIVSSVKHGAEIETLGKRKFVVVHYDIVSKLESVLRARRFNFVVLDEAHSIKDYKSKRSQACVPLCQAARRCVLLTGTPLLNRPIEILQPLRALLPRLEEEAGRGLVNDFGERYCAGGADRFAPHRGCSNPEELFSLLTSSVMIRRLKKDVLKDLPPKLRNIVWMQLEEKERRPLAEIQGELEAVDSKIKQLRFRGKCPEVDDLELRQKTLISRYYHDTAAAKTRLIKDYLDELLQDREDSPKFLFFAHHTSLLDAAMQVANQRKTRCIRIDGDTDKDKRQALVSQFQLDPSVRVAILSIKAAGVGLTLTEAALVVFGELPWTPGEVIQAEDRAHRIGQADCVNVRYLMCRGTCDDLVWNKLQKKLMDLGKCLDNDGTRMEVGDGGAGGAAAAAAHAARPERPQTNTLDAFISRPGAGAAAGAAAGAHGAPPHPAAGPGPGGPTPMYAAGGGGGGPVLGVKRPAPAPPGMEGGYGHGAPAGPSGPHQGYGRPPGGPGFAGHGPGPGQGYGAPAAGGRPGGGAAAAEDDDDPIVIVGD